MAPTHLSRLHETTWEENILFSALLELTYKCNLDCFFCYNDLGLEGEPLSRQQYFDLLTDLAEMQVMNVILSGGEPLAHPDFFEIGSRARELGFVVRVKSNGHAMRGSLAQRLVDEVDPFVVEVSLHGATAETHDRQTRVPGSFVRLCSNVRGMVEIGLRVKINSTLTRWNETEIPAMFDLAEDLEVPLAVDAMVTPRDNGDRSPLEIAPTQAGRIGLYAEMRSREQLPSAEAECAPSPGTKKNCGAGASTVAIDPFGNIYPCVQWRRPLGNLHESPIGTIWQSSPGLAEVRRVNEEVGETVQDMAAQGMRVYHCMGLSEELEGDPKAVNPRALDNATLKKGVQDGGKRNPLPIVY